MTDDELIKAVAEKAGGTKIGLTAKWRNPSGIIVNLPPWLYSVDAALGVIKPSNEFELWKDDTGWNCSDHGTFSHGQPTACRAILLAFLEAKNEGNTKAIG